MDANSLPVGGTFQNLTVRASESIAGPQARTCSDRVWLELSDRHDTRFEHRNETGRGDPPQIARHEQREIADVRRTKHGDRRASEGQLARLPCDRMDRTSSF
jgi:hypothetical protein